MRLAYTKAHNLGRLHAELLAAVPSVRPVGGIAVMAISGNGSDLILEVPDGADSAAITATVNTHNKAAADAADAAVATAETTERNAIKALRDKAAAGAITPPETADFLKRVYDRLMLGKGL